MPRHCIAVLACVLVAGLVGDVPAQAGVLYTANFSGAVGTQPTGFSAFADTGMGSRNSGGGEYEQSWMSANGVAIAAYSTADDIDSGAWRDVTVTTKSRFSGAGNNDNGLILRARGIADTASGNFYHVRFQGNALELMRFNGGVGAALKTSTTSESIAAPADRWLRVSIENVPKTDTDGVKIHAELSKTVDFSQIIATLDYLDTSTSAITRAGGVGYRSDNTVSASSRAVFDDLVVNGDNPSVLWYDDYNDGTAPRMVSYLSGSRSQSIVSQKYNFDGSGAAIGLLNFPAETSRGDWTNTQTSAMMRLNTMSATQEDGGLIFRARGVDSATTGDGDYYLYRLFREEAGTGQYLAQLFRHDDGAGFTQLGSINLSAANVPESTNIYLRAEATDVPGGVYVLAMSSLNADFSNPYGLFSYLDNSPKALFGPGSAGFRVNGSGAINFDNFTVMAIPEPAGLLLLGLGGLIAVAFRRR
jgi:hypothetical protein